MAFNPQCSWAVTYNQMWNLSMWGPLPKNNNKSAFSHYSGDEVVGPRSRMGNHGAHNPTQVKRNKSDYC